ncbi:GntR family transcriptional regulator [Bauldia sp.]|uniref:GntR family transcriptional regulator n=1 Tax=Bauldia sp. TaxID=2575872 RepID=UPI003BA9638D
MFRDTSDQTKPEFALEALRKRICLADPTEALPLHEGMLAEEFGMSRTPIRQVLQRLAYERLVEIRSGVGTVATPMDPANRSRDIVTHQEILRAILAHPPAELSVSQHADVIALGALIAGAEDLDPSLHFELRARLLAVLAGLVADPILKDAFQAAHWRVIRWHMRDVALDRVQAFKSTQRLANSVAAYHARNGGDLFSRILADDLAP